MLIKIHHDNPEPRKIQQVADIVKNGGVIIYPTDTLYGLGCDIFNKKAVERICRIRHLDPRKAMLSFICKDIGQIAEYAWQMDNQLFKLLKKNLPGPFTFILKSSNAVPKLLKNKKRTIGVRIPENTIAIEIVKALGRPLLSISLKDNSDNTPPRQYLTDPREIHERFGNEVDLIIGPQGWQGLEPRQSYTPSTLVDCTTDPYTILREGEKQLL